MLTVTEFLKVALECSDFSGKGGDHLHIILV